MLRWAVHMIELLVLKDCKEKGRDHEPRCSAVADQSAVDVPTESDLLGPKGAPH